VSQIIVDPALQCHPSRNNVLLTLVLKPLPNHRVPYESTCVPITSETYLLFHQLPSLRTGDNIHRSVDEAMTLIFLRFLLAHDPQSRLNVVLGLPVWLMTVPPAGSSPRSVVAWASQRPPRTSPIRIWSTVRSRQSFTVSETHVLLTTAYSPIRCCLPSLRPAIRSGE
jgi:hypothetical protein